MSFIYSRKKVVFKEGDIVALNPDFDWKQKYRERLLKLRFKITKIEDIVIHLETLYGERLPDGRKNAKVIDTGQLILIKSGWRIA